MEIHRRGITGDSSVLLRLSLSLAASVLGFSLLPCKANTALPGLQRAIVTYDVVLSFLGLRSRSFLFNMLSRNLPCKASF